MDSRGKLLSRRGEVPRAEPRSRCWFEGLTRRGAVPDAVITPSSADIIPPFAAAVGTGVPVG